MKTQLNWIVYIVRCKNASLYTGITNDLKRRVSEHNSCRGGHYTSGFGPVSLLWKESHPTRSSALKREAQIKSWTRKKKLTLTSHVKETPLELPGPAVQPKQ